MYDSTYSNYDNMASRVIRENSGRDDVSPQKRSSRGPAGVSFQPKLSVYSVSGAEDEFDLGGKRDMSLGSACPLCV